MPKRPIEIETASEEIGPLTPNPWFSLDGNVLAKTKDKLYFISRRIEKLSRYAGQTFEGGDGYDIHELDERRKWNIKRLRHLNAELHHLLGSLLGVKLEIVESLEFLIMAEIERSYQKDLETRRSRVNKTYGEPTRDSADKNPWKIRASNNK